MITLKELEDRRKLLVLEKSETDKPMEAALIEARIKEISYLIDYLFQKGNKEFKGTMSNQLSEKMRAEVELELIGFSKEDYDKLLLESDF